MKTNQNKDGKALADDKANTESSNKHQVKHSELLIFHSTNCIFENFAGLREMSGPASTSGLRTVANFCKYFKRCMYNVWNKGFYFVYCVCF